MGESPKGALAADDRYKKVAGLIARVDSHAGNAAHGTLMSAFARGEWTMYDLFCDGKDRSGCTTMLPEDRDILADAPELAGARILHLERAYLALDGASKIQAAERIKSLYRSIPPSATVQRQMINQVYAELFAPTQKPTATPAARLT